MDAERLLLRSEETLDEVRAIARCHDQSMSKRRGRNEAVLDWHRPASGAETRQQFSPLQTGLALPGKTVQTLNAGVEPSLERRPFLPLGQEPAKACVSPQEGASTACSVRVSTEAFVRIERTLRNREHFHASMTDAQMVALALDGRIRDEDDARG